MSDDYSVELREVIPEHRDALFSQYSNPQSIHMAAFVFGDPFDRDAFEARLDRLLSDRSILYRSILANEDIVGAIASFFMEGEREVTYGIHPDYWDKGITTDALKLFIEIEEERPLQAHAASDNYGSLRVLEKCGFRPIGSEVSFAPARDAQIEETVMALD